MDIQVAANQFYNHSKHIKGYSKSTIRRYKYCISFLIKYFKIATIEEVTEKKIRELFYFGRTERNWSVSTYCIFHKSLLVFCRWCIGQGYLEQNPLVVIEKPKAEQKLPQKLTKQDALRLLECIYHFPGFDTFLRYRNHALFATFLFAGLRKSELLNLKYQDVDIKNATIFISKGKGAKDRMVPISEALMFSLNRYLSLRSKLVPCDPEFFISQQKNIRFTDSGLKHLVSKAKKISGIKFSVHKLRHSFATLMIEGGCDIYSLSKMMGHSHIGTTTIYLSASVEHLRNQIIKHPLNNIC